MVVLLKGEHWGKQGRHRGPLINRKLGLRCQATEEHDGACHLGHLEPLSQGHIGAASALDIAF